MQSAKYLSKSGVTCVFGCASTQDLSRSVAIELRYFDRLETTLSTASRPKPQLKSTLITINIAPDIVDGLDGVRMDMPHGLARNEVIQTVLRDWLVTRGYLRTPPQRDDAN